MKGLSLLTLGLSLLFVGLFLPASLAQTPTSTVVPTTQPSTIPTKTAATTTKDPLSWACPEGYEGSVRHPFDCKSFLICDPAGRPCPFECPDNLYFNPVSLACDWPESVPDCKGGSPPPPTATPRYMDDNSVNYRNLNRNNFAKNVEYLAQFLRGKTAAGLCDEIKAHLAL